jgi:hypothetical protein
MAGSSNPMSSARRAIIRGNRTNVKPSSSPDSRGRHIHNLVANGEAS